MRYITNPEITLLASSFLDFKHGSLPYDFAPGEVEDSEALVEFAGRLCYLSFGGEHIDGHRAIAGRTSNAEYLRNVILQRHGSVLEHANFSFLFEGVSRTLTHELVRHRHFSYSQLSQRYVDESDVRFVVPPALLALGPNSEAFQAWTQSCDDDLIAYRTLLDRLSVELPRAPGEGATAFRKQLRGTARSVLPGCTETKIVVTGNLRAWRHFFVLRGSAAADAEIRRLALLVFDELTTLAPNAFEDFEERDGVLITDVGSI